MDAIAGYKYLVQDLGFEPLNIILGGDSSGGHLAFSLMYYLHQSQLPSLHDPGALLLLSPTADWAVTHIGPQSSMTRNVYCDYVQAVIASGYTKAGLLGSLPAEFAEKSVWISPASLKIKTSGMFAGFPRTCIVSGGAEQTLDPMVTLRDRVEADIGPENVKYIEAPDASHNFLLTGWDEPERENVLQEIGKWAKGL